MKKYSPLALAGLIIVLSIFIAVKWTKWDTVIIIAIAAAVASYFVYRSFKKSKKES